MSLDPWSYSAKTGNEHAEQVALFMWANMAQRFGPLIANQPSSYEKAGWAQTQFEHRGELGYIKPSEPLPQLKWLHAIKNQRDGDNRVAGGKAKAEGVKAGVSDIFLPVSQFNTLEKGIYAGNGFSIELGLYIELKRKDSGTPSAIQLEFQADMREAGYKCEIIHGWEAGRDCILEYLGVR